MYYRFNKLNELDINSIEERIQNLDPEITVLDLSDGFLGNRSATDLLRINEAISYYLPKLETIKLNKNNFGCLSLNAFHIYTASLPRTLKKIGFSSNSLGNFSNIRVNTLDLSNNGLVGSVFNEQKKLLPNLEKLINVINSMKNVECINLNNNFISLENMELLVNRLDNKQINIGIDNIVMNIDHFWSHAIVKKITNIINDDNKELKIFNDIKFVKEISEDDLIRHLSLLERSGTPLCLFICGLLLEDRIRNTFPSFEDRSIADEMAYREKRQHDAISFYAKAARNKLFHKLVTPILRAMKDTCAFPSIKSRLDCYDLNEAVNVPLINQLGLFRLPKNSGNEEAGCAHSRALVLYS